MQKRKKKGAKKVSAKPKGVILSKKQMIDKVCDVLVFGQLFVDELEEFKEVSIFKFELKRWSMMVIEEFREKVNNLWGNIQANPSKDSSSVTLLYHINYELLGKINKLTIDEKKILNDNMEGIIKQLREQRDNSYKEEKSHE
jgi:hypothetical protein